MNSTNGNSSEQTLLFIPDISGFTKFVNETEISHSEHIITEKEINLLLLKRWHKYNECISNFMLACVNMSLREYVSAGHV